MQRGNFGHVQNAGKTQHFFISFGPADAAEIETGIPGHIPANLVLKSEPFIKLKETLSSTFENQGESNERSDDVLKSIDPRDTKIKLAEAYRLLPLIENAQAKVVKIILSEVVPVTFGSRLVDCLFLERIKVLR